MVWGSGPAANFHLPDFKQDTQSSDYIPIGKAGTIKRMAAWLSVPKKIYLQIVAIQTGLVL
jgi:hypothetical protein